MPTIDVGDLRVGLTADTRSFTRGITDAGLGAMTLVGTVDELARGVGRAEARFNAFVQSAVQFGSNLLSLESSLTVAERSFQGLARVNRELDLTRLVPGTLAADAALTGLAGTLIDIGNYDPDQAFGAIEALGDRAVAFASAFESITVVGPDLTQGLDVDAARLEQLTALVTAFSRELSAVSFSDRLFPFAQEEAERVFSFIQRNFVLLDDAAFEFADTLADILTRTPAGATVFEQERQRLRDIDALGRQVRAVVNDLENARSPELIAAAEAERLREGLMLLRDINTELAGLAQADRPLAGDLGIVGSLTGAREQLANLVSESQQLEAALQTPGALQALGSEIRERERDVERLRGVVEGLLSGELAPDGAQFILAGGSLERLESAFQQVDAGTLEEQVSGLNAEMRSLTQLGDAAGAALGRAFADAVISARSLSDIVDGLVQTLVRAAATAFVGNPLANLFNSLVGRQFGGRVLAGQTYLVGERGPEVFRADTSGTVIPNNQLGALGGGTTINVYGNDRPEEVLALVAQAAQAESAAQVQSLVENSRQRRLI